VVLDKRPKDAVPFDFEARLRELGLDASREKSNDPKKETASAYKLMDRSRDMKIRQLMHMASKHCLDIDGLGEAVAEQLVDLGLVDIPSDVFALEAKHWFLLEKFKEKSVENILGGLEASKSSELWRAIHALGIPNVGLQTAKDLAGHFGTFEAFLSSKKDDYLIYECNSSSGLPISTIPNIGRIVAESILTHLGSSYGASYARGLKSSLPGLQPDSGAESKFINSLKTDELKAAYIKLLKSASSQLLSDTISAICYEIDYELATKLVSYSPDLNTIVNSDPEEVCEKIRAKNAVSKLRLLAAKFAEPAVLELITKTGAPTHATNDEHGYCLRQHRYRNAKILGLFGQTVDRDLPADIQEARVRKLFAYKKDGKPINSTAFRLWKKRENVDFAHLTIEDVESKHFGAVIKYIDEAASVDMSELKGVELRKATRRIRVVSKKSNTIVISGRVEGLNRDEAKAHAEKLGYIVADAVTSAVSILAVGSEPGPSKIKKAEKLGVKIIPFGELEDINGAQAGTG